MGGKTGMIKFITHAKMRKNEKLPQNEKMRKMEQNGRGRGCRADFITR